MDQLEEISRQTLAGKTAQTQLIAYKRDFQNARVGTFIAAAQEFDLEAQKIQSTKSQTASELWLQAIDRLQQVPNDNPRYLDAQKLIAAYQVKQKMVNDTSSGTYIQGAKQFALAAAKAAQNPPHSALEWEQISNLWEKAINQLENIRVQEPSYVEAQGLLAQYQTNLGIIKSRLQAESESKEIMNQSNREIKRLIASPPTNKNEMRAEIQEIITQLNTIKSGTTAYPEAQRLLALANKKIQQLQ